MKENSSLETGKLLLGYGIQRKGEKIFQKELIRWTPSGGLKKRSKTFVRVFNGKNKFDEIRRECRMENPAEKDFICRKS
jgi:hypothetical protein